MSEQNYEFHKNNEKDTIYWVNKTDSIGKHLFTFDKKKSIIYLKTIHSH